MIHSEIPKASDSTWTITYTPFGTSSSTLPAGTRFRVVSASPAWISVMATSLSSSGSIAGVTMNAGGWGLLGGSLGAPMVTRVFVLGRVEIESEEGLVTEPRFPGRQGRRLFAYLVCNRQHPVTPEGLAEALWSETVPAAWQSALHALVSKLRKLLEEVGDGESLRLTAEHGNYLLRIGSDVWIDREAAAEAIDEAEAWLRSGDVKRAWGPCNIAAISARRPFLPGEEGDWFDRERGRLHAILVRAVDGLVDIWSANDESALAVEAARESIELEPFRETGYQRLIRLHQALGNRAEALRVYEDCRRLLASELGVDPSPDTEALFLEVLGQS